MAAREADRIVESKLLDRAADLLMPVFVGHGRADISSPIDWAVALAAKIPDVELFVAEHDGHGGADLTSWTRSVTDRLVSG